ncbi:CUAEP/CCAEP-tail radical SAM (seleno)protein [Thioalkalivibrio sp. HK1]|uniref:CUAEP/CCAEP-tail radical SAM (seleno)protein n=1 Tax=Thioalkalivibrio sp. HK1 TaxID=1469245 RepID=UPI00046F50DF|nr:CUAEP/CCAEP-tail radical SAM protein [Thioalkalivibrio sp. HK1]
MRVVLINFYELGRQPFGLAEPARWLDDAGFDTRTIDLAVDPLPARGLADASMIALHLPMHTATSMAFELLADIRKGAPDAVLCAYGLYAPANARRLQALGVGTIIGGEYEPHLLALAERIRKGSTDPDLGIVGDTARIDFRPPLRASLPALDRYAALNMPDGHSRTLGFAEGSRGCKHLCRHCPVTPVYRGRFRIVPVDIVIDDIADQVQAGAEHISFGDPDFLNGPTHALRIVEALNRRFPSITYDATIKIEHIVRHREILPTLADTGCLFLISAVESIDDAILERLAKGHRASDFEQAVELVRKAGIALSPTFVPFTPWTSLAGYMQLLQRLIDLRLVESVPAVQLAIRLLVPGGSLLFEIEGFEDIVGDFDERLLGHPWQHRNPAVDALQKRVEAIAQDAADRDEPRRTTFERILGATAEAMGEDPPILPSDIGSPIPAHSEPWYCCAEPTVRQLASLRGPT